MSRPLGLVGGVLLLVFIASPAWSAPSEIKLDRGFLDSILGKLPVCPFEKAGQYRGTASAFKLIAIEPKTRQIVVSCEVGGEFDEASIVAGLKPSDRAAIKPDAPRPGPKWRKFRFTVRVAINIEPSEGGAPRLRFKVEEVRRRELEGVVGPLAKVMGRGFDQIVTTYADKKAAGLNDHLNAEVVRRVSLFQDYGMLCGVDYFATHLVMLFDLTRFRSEGIAGFVFAANEPGTIPLYRWVNPKRGDHFYTTRTDEPDPRTYRSEGVACYVLPRADAQSYPLFRWRGKLECLYTMAKEDKPLQRAGFRLAGITCFVYPHQVGNSVPLYRFLDPVRGLHFYTIHPQAEFAK
jgi:hypothetical protein